MVLKDDSQSCQDGDSVDRQETIESIGEHIIVSYLEDSPVKLDLHSELAHSIRSVEKLESFKPSDWASRLGVSSGHTGEPGKRRLETMKR